MACESFFEGVGGESVYSLLHHYSSTVLGTVHS